LIQDILGPSGGSGAIECFQQNLEAGAWPNRASAKKCCHAERFPLSSCSSKCGVLGCGLSCETGPASAAITADAVPGLIVGRTLLNIFGADFGSDHGNVLEGECSSSVQQLSTFRGAIRPHKGQEPWKAP
jgi:hypothetical protein